MLKIWQLTFFCAIALISSASAAVIVGEGELTAAVTKEFIEQGISDPVEVEFFGGQTVLEFEKAQNARVLISGLKFDEEQNRFSARAEIFADGQPAAQTALSGRAFVLRDVWVPSADIEKGEVIGKDMLKKVSMRKNRIKSLHLTEAEKLIGTQAKRGLKEGRMITERDVGAVMIIRKGKIVNSLYRRKGMSITAQAEALEDGALGQNIAVINTKSGKKFFARVVDADTVEIPQD